MLFQQTLALSRNIIKT